MIDNVQAGAYAALLRQLDPQNQQEGLDIASLPPEMQQYVEQNREAFAEGDLDKLDTSNEVQRLLAHFLGQQTAAEGMENPAANALPHLDAQQLIALLVDYIKSGGQMPGQQGGGGGGGGGGGRNLGAMGNAGNFASSGPGSFGGGTAGSMRSGGPSSSGGPISTQAPNTDSASLRGNNNAQRAFNYFVEQGFTPQQAAGIVGNLQAESGVNPGQHQIGGPAFGIAQWEGSRQDDLRQFAAQRGKPVDDLGVQLDFIMHEFNTTEGRSLRSVRNASSAADAAYAFMRDFERPGKPHTERRISAANAALQAFT